MEALPSGCLTAPPSLMSCLNLLRVDSIPLPTLMMKMLKSIGILTHPNCRDRFFKNVSVLQYSAAKGLMKIFHALVEAYITLLLMTVSG